MKNRFHLIVLFFVLSLQFCKAQNELQVTDVTVANDTIKKTKINPLAPAKAAFYSAILPGLGQAYNKKYWKIPIVYGAIGTSIYSYVWNNKKYHLYRDAYKSRLKGLQTDEFVGIYDNQRLISAQKFHQRNRDLSMLVACGFYILNIVDANIDAHLMQFNVNENLSITPELQENEFNSNRNLGVRLTYNF
jgi:hypothetical protein